MKKIISCALILAIAISVVGCDLSNLVPSGKAELSRGNVSGNKYTNEFLGFTFTAPDSWVYSTDEEIAAAMNLGMENFLDENYKKALENNPSIYDMMVVDSVTRSNITVAYENLEKSFASNITVDQYISALKTQLNSVSSIKYTFTDKTEKVSLGETEFTRSVCEATAYGVSMTQAYYLYKIDGYMAVVIVTIQGGVTLADVEACFS